MNHAAVLDYCSALLEAHGARPVPKADPGWKFTTFGSGRRCAGCRHPLAEHGATGECWHLADYQGPDCTCGREIEEAA